MCMTIWASCLNSNENAGLKTIKAQTISYKVFFKLQIEILILISYADIDLLLLMKLRYTDNQRVERMQKGESVTQEN